MPGTGRFCGSSTAPARISRLPRHTVGHLSSSRAREGMRKLRGYFVSLERTRRKQGQVATLHSSSRAVRAMHRWSSFCARCEQTRSMQPCMVGLRCSLLRDMVTML
ncbi:unnamed protein product [Symbiodinium sp. CCMP2456]|nr:unnamed protein product [Symbiodinium sp. CCMP2456]